MLLRDVDEETIDPITQGDILSGFYYHAKNTTRKKKREREIGNRGVAYGTMEVDEDEGRDVGPFDGRDEVASSDCDDRAEERPTVKTKGSEIFSFFHLFFFLWWLLLFVV